MSDWTDMMTSTMDIYRLVKSLDAGNGPVQSYILYQAGVPCSAQPQNDNSEDPFHNEKRYKQKVKAYFDTVTADVDPTDRVKIGLKTYEQRGTGDDQIDAGQVTRLDLLEVVDG